MLDLVERVRRQEDRPARGGALAQEVLELVLHQRVEAAGGLVEDQQLGLVHERLDQADLLTVPLGQLLDGPVQLSSKRSASTSRVAVASTPRTRASQSSWAAGGEPLVEGEVPRDVPDAAMHLDDVAVAVQAEDLGRAGGGPEVVEQHADGRGLARAVGAEEPEDLARLHLEVDIGDAPRTSRTSWSARRPDGWSRHGVILGSQPAWPPGHKDLSPSPSAPVGGHELDGGLDHQSRAQAVGDEALAVGDLDQVLDPLDGDAAPHRDVRAAARCG